MILKSKNQKTLSVIFNYLQNLKFLEKNNSILFDFKEKKFLKDTLLFMFHTLINLTWIFWSKKLTNKKNLFLISIDF